MENIYVDQDVLKTLLIRLANMYNALNNSAKKIETLLEYIDALESRIETLESYHE